MEFAQMLQRLWRHRVLVGFGVLVAAMAAVLTVSDVSLSPLELEPRGSEFGAAQTTVYVDTVGASVTTTQVDTASLVARAQVFARFINSGAVREAAARRLRIPAEEITVSGPNPDAPGQQNVQPPAQQRANALLGGGEYSVFVDTEQSAPTITLFTQAPDGEGASELASAIVRALRSEVEEEQRAARPELRRSLRDQLRVRAVREDRTISAAERREEERQALSAEAVIRPLGAPVGGSVVDQTRSAIAVLVFVAAVIVWCVGILLVSALARTVRRR